MTINVKVAVTNAASALFAVKQTVSVKVEPKRGFSISVGPSVAAVAAITTLVEDQFGGSGSISGRLPDTTNNGNTWTLHTGSISISGGRAVAPLFSAARVSIEAGANRTVHVFAKAISLINNTVSSITTRGSIDGTKRWELRRADASLVTLYEIDVNLIDRGSYTSAIPATTDVEVIITATATKVEGWLVGERGSILAVDSTVLAANTRHGFAQIGADSITVDWAKVTDEVLIV